MFGSLITKFLSFFFPCSWQDEGKAPDLYVELDFKEVNISIHTAIFQLLVL